jgi:hypothetical protein
MVCADSTADVILSFEYEYVDVMSEQQAGAA